MRVTFKRDYDYTPSAERRVTIAYKAGTTETVKREAGEAAIKAGAAEEAKPDPLDHDDNGKKGGAKAPID